jgi:hypothetical protein
MKTTNYDDAVKTVAENLSGMDLFEASVLLARMFDVGKKKTMDDLLAVRKEMLLRGAL